MTIPQIGSAALVILLAAGTTTHGGAIRIDLPELLGEHRFEGPPQRFSAGYSNLSLDVSSLNQARLFVEGTLEAGRGHGDGILRENTEFVLDPLISEYDSFRQTDGIPGESGVGPFSFDFTYVDLYFPTQFSPPSPGVVQPALFSIALELSLGPNTELPPLIDPNSPPVGNEEGFVVDEPILANITTAFVILEGPGIPEPASGVIAIAACLLIGGCRVRLRRWGNA